MIFIRLFFRYVFKGHIVRTMEEKSSLVPWTLVPTPPAVQQAFDEVLGISDRADNDRANFRSRSIFINAQWAFGGEGSGAPGNCLSLFDVCFICMLSVGLII